MSVLRIMDDTCSKIALQKGQVKLSNQQLKLLVERYLINGLKREDPLFAFLYKEIVYAGSFYEGLKVSKPDEYDLNIVMKLPASFSKIKVTTQDAPFEHLRIENMGSILATQLQSTERSHKVLLLKQLLAWCDENGTFLHDKFQKWFSSLVHNYIDKNKKTLKRSLKTRRLSVQNIFSALTLKTEDLSVDLVACFEFKSSLLPPEPFRTIGKKMAWYAIAGSPSEPNMWRLSFVRQEREMLHNTGNVKPAVKLIKKMLASLHWDKKFGVKSYHIKTVALWEILESPNSCHQNLYYVFIHLLRRLEIKVRENQILSFWDQRMNLSARDFNKINRTDFADCLKQITHMFQICAQNTPAHIQTIIMRGISN